MSWLSKLPIDRFLLAIIAAAVLGTVLPVTGVGVDIADWATTLAIALLIFLYGARLSPAETLAGLKHWRLHLTILGFTYLMFPLLGLGIAALAGNWLNPALVTGLVYLTLVPSTVQSSIAFTSIARGNVAAALCCASISNLAGVVITPLLATMLLNTGSGGLSLAAVGDIALQILLPFVVGQCARPWVGAWFNRQKTLTMLVDRGSILLVVYSAFSAGVVAGIWNQVTPQNLGLVIVLDLVMLAVVLIFTTMTSRLLRFSVEDEIAIVFCGSKKSMASGLPMANIIFPAATVGLIVLPLMLFHQMQLMVCAALARRYSRRPEGDVQTVTASA